MNICFLLERGQPPRINPVYRETFALLERYGIKVALCYPEQNVLRIDRLKTDADLYLLKSDTELSLSLARAYEALGAKVLNSAHSSLLLKNKVIATAMLAHSGIRTPASWIAAHTNDLQSQLAQSPLLFKPYRGYHGVGIHAAETVVDMPAADFYADLCFAQTYLPPTIRKDLKIFVIGDRAFGIRKPFSQHSYLHTGEPVKLTAEQENVALECGRIFNLEFYGIDIAEDHDQYYVIDINYFPGYRGVPNAPQLLCQQIMKHLQLSSA